MAVRPYDAAALAASVRASVLDIVQKQASVSGIDGINDGEHSKSSFTAYLRTRLDGLSQTATPYNAYGPTRDYLEFKGAYDETAVMLAARPINQVRPLRNVRNAACTAPLRYVGLKEVAADIENLSARARDGEASRKASSPPRCRPATSKPSTATSFTVPRTSISGSARQRDA